jgi:hypothetical protein
MKKQNTITTAGNTTQTVRNWDTEVICITIVFLVIFALTVGNPDLLDALVSQLQK